MAITEDPVICLEGGLKANNGIIVNEHLPQRIYPVNSLIVVYREIKRYRLVLCSLHGARVGHVIHRETREDRAVDDLEDHVTLSVKVA